MINKVKTIEKFNYNPDTLAPTSTSKVCWTCDKCASEREYSKAYCERKKTKASTDGGQELCQKCAHSHRKGKVSPKGVNVNQVAMPAEVDVKATMDRFGYDPTTLSPWSRQRVVLNCKECSKACEPRRCGLNRYKSLQDGGSFKCTGCWTAARRRGVKASDTTKQAMASSQKQRREREKVQPNAGAGSVKSGTVPPSISSGVSSSIFTPRK